MRRVYTPALAALRCRGISLEHPLIRAGAATLSVGSGQLGLNHVDVALAIGPDLVPRRMLLRTFAGIECTKDLECPAIQDVDDRRPSQVQESLVRREGNASRLQAVLAVQADELLGDEFSF